MWVGSDVVWLPTVGALIDRMNELVRLLESPLGQFCRDRPCDQDGRHVVPPVPSGAQCCRRWCERDARRAFSFHLVLLAGGNENVSSGSGTDPPRTRDLEVSRGRSDRGRDWPATAVHATTVRKHLQNLYARLQTHDRLTPVVRARDLGLIREEDLSTEFESNGTFDVTSVT